MFFRQRYQINPTSSSTHPYSELITSDGPLLLNARGGYAASGLFSDGKHYVHFATLSAGAYYLRHLSPNWEFRPGVRYELGILNSQYSRYNPDASLVERRSNEMLMHGISACLNFAHLTPDHLFNRSGYSLESCATLYSSSGSLTDSSGISANPQGLGWGTSITISNEMRIDRLVDLTLFGVRLAYDQPAETFPGIFSASLQVGLGFTPFRSSVSNEQMREARNAQECRSPESRLSIRDYNLEIQRLISRNLNLRNAITRQNPNATANIPITTLNNINDESVRADTECAQRDSNINLLEQEFQSLSHIQEVINQARASSASVSHSTTGVVQT